MNIFDDLMLLDRLDRLIRIKGTGTPGQLAARLEICERHLYRLIGQLRDTGLPIGYDKNKHTYYYKEPVELSFEMKVNGKSLLFIKGGKNNFDFFSPLTFFVSTPPDLCHTFNNHGAQ